VLRGNITRKRARDCGCQLMSPCSGPLRFLAVLSGLERITVLRSQPPSSRMRRETAEEEGFEPPSDPKARNGFRVSRVSLETAKQYSPDLCQPSAGVPRAPSEGRRCPLMYSSRFSRTVPPSPKPRPPTRSVARPRLRLGYTPCSHPNGRSRVRDGIRSSTKPFTEGFSCPPVPAVTPPCFGLSIRRSRIRAPSLPSVKAPLMRGFPLSGPPLSGSGESV
jgi:hypothetical protein